MRFAGRRDAFQRPAESAGRTVVRLREMLLSNTDLARKLAALENKYDAQFKVVFDAIRELMLPPAPPKRQIGFHVHEGATQGYRVRRRK